MSHKNILIQLFTFALLAFGMLFLSGHVFAAGADVCNAKDPSTLPACQSVNVDQLGFKIPSLGDILTFTIRGFFVIAGLAALFYMLMGAFAWVTSGGDKDAVSAAQQKIQAAVLGLIIVVAVLAIIWTLEQVIFKRRICLGLSCPVTLPGLIETTGGEYCCTCPPTTQGADRGDASAWPIIDGYTEKCPDQ